jgi:diacylglycerol kinase family enzyme
MRHVAATHLLVGNPTAQSGKNAARIDEARRLLTDAGVACDFLATEPEGRTVAAVTAALDATPYTCVIYMGGDGTFREVAAGLLGSARADEVALGMLPTGTANDQGQSFGLHAGDEELAGNVRVVLGGHETRLDAGRIKAGERSELFFDSAGWGLSARVLAARNLDREKIAGFGPLKELYRDQLVYAGALLRVFLASYATSDKFNAIVDADGVRHELAGLTDLVISGTRFYGGAWVFDRTSRHDDGLFEIVPFCGKRDWASKAIVDLDGNPLTEERLNAVGIEHSKPFRGGRIVIDFAVPDGHAPLAAQIDGEEFVATSRVEVDVLRQALRVIVPGPS